MGLDTRISGWEQRVFLKDVGRFARGTVGEYPRTTWKDIARSAKMPLERFTEPVASAAAQFAKPRPGRPPKNRG